MNKPAIVLVLLVVVSSPLRAQITVSSFVAGDPGQGTSVLYGAWGTPGQCEAHHAGNVDDFRLFPYIIDDQWLRQGFMWCRLSWQEGNDIRSQAQALAQCGEDALRDYRLYFDLRDERLQITWSADFKTGLLHRC